MAPTENGHLAPSRFTIDECQRDNPLLTNEQHTSQQRAGEENRNCPSYHTYCNGNIIIILYGLFAFIVGIAIGATSVVWIKSQQPPNSSVPCTHNILSCPDEWIGYLEKCYYFSKEEKNWDSSQSFCLAYNASLARIENKEKDFVMAFKGNDIFWIGLSRDPGQLWKWTDGENATLEVVGDGGPCAYLNDDATASSVRCSTEHRWICIKEKAVNEGNVVAKFVDDARFFSMMKTKLDPEELQKALSKLDEWPLKRQL